MISSGDFDVVLLQEAYISHSGGWEVLAQQLGYHFYFQILRRDAGMGSLVMSKYPIQPLPSIRAQVLGPPDPLFPTSPHPVRGIARRHLQRSSRIAAPGPRGAAALRFVKAPPTTVRDPGPGNHRHQSPRNSRR